MTLEALQKLADEYFGALKSQQYEALIRVLASDVLWHEPGTSAIAGDHAGRSQLVQFFSKLMELSDGTLAFEEVGAVSVTDRLASAPLRFSATRAGRRFSGNATMVIRGAEGRVAEVWHFAADIAAVDAFWRGEAPSATSAVAASEPTSGTTATTTPVDLESGDLAVRFQRAAEASRTLPKRPDSATLLSLYALYKQAGAGDAAGERPGLTDPVGRAKFDAWEKLRGVDMEQAKTDYIALVRTLLGS